jgi:hypothetical protein
VKDEAGAPVVEYAASAEHIATLEGELKVAVDQEAETAQRLASEHQRRAALDQQLHEIREEAIRLMFDEASQTCTVMVAEADELLEAARVEANREADQITKQASAKADEMVALARHKAMAIIDAGHDEVTVLVDDVPGEIADLNTEQQELTHRLGVMETIHDELVATLKLVAEISVEELVETQHSLKKLGFPETEQPPTEPNSEYTTSGSAVQDEFKVSAQVKADPLIPEVQDEAHRVVDEAPAEPSREQDRPEPQSEPMDESDDDDTENLVVIIDDRDLEHPRFRYQRWLNRYRENRTRHNEAVSKRFSRVLSSTNIVEGADPAEVEAQIRNLSHGTNSA